MRHSMQSTARVLLALLCGTTLAACATTPTTATDCVPCAALKPISFSASGDTGQTVREVRGFNAVLREVCRDANGE